MMFLMIERLLSARAMKIAAVTLLVVYVVLVARWTARAIERPDQFGNDFLLFWTAARMSVEGAATHVWDAQLMLDSQRLTLPWTPQGLIWAYPPPALMLVRPLEMLPFWAGFLAWSVAGLAAYLAMVRAMVPDRWTVTAALAFPAAFTALYCGQTGLFVAAALGGGLWLLERRPWIAGVLIGLLVCKPQFGVLLPLLLIGTGCWRSVASAGLTVAALALMSWAAFGSEPWLAFLRTLPDVSAAVTSPGFPLHRTPSVFAFAFSLGATREAALAVHAAVAGAVALATLMLWRRNGTPHALKVASAACAVLIATPYLWDYDLPVLAIAAAALAAHGRVAGLSLRERLLIVWIAATPMVLVGVSEAVGVSLSGLAVLGCWAGVTAVGRGAIRAGHKGHAAADQRFGLAFTAS